MKRLILTCLLVLLLSSSAIADIQTDFWFVSASYEEAPLVIKINGDPSEGQAFAIGDTVNITCYVNAIASSYYGFSNFAKTVVELVVTGPSGTASETGGDSAFDPSGIVQVNTETTLTISYPLTAPGTHTVSMSSFAMIEQTDEFGFPTYGSEGPVTASLAFEVVLPVALDDNYNIKEDTTLVEGAPGVLVNDTGGVLTAEYVSGGGPANGVVTLNSDGSFAYTPNANWFGTDTFMYRAYNGTAYSNIATVTIVVEEVPADEETEDLSDKVTDLVDTGALNQGQGNSLTSKLDKIVEKLEKGQINVACNLLQAFINEVNSLISEGVLSSSEGQPLIDKAENIMMELGCS